MDAPSSVEECVTAFELEQIYAIELGASRFTGEELDSYELALETQYHASDQQVDYLFQATCAVRDAKNEPLAEIRASMVAAFSSESATSSIDHDVLVAFGSGVALYAAYPYIRESVQGLAAKLGLPGLTLRMMKRGEPAPFNVGP